MNKIVKSGRNLWLKAVAYGSVLGSVVMAGMAKAALDADVQDVASTTQVYLKDQFKSVLVYIIPAILAVYVIFWAFKFVKRKMSSVAH